MEVFVNQMLDKYLGKDLSSIVALYLQPYTYDGRSVYGGLSAQPFSKLQRISENQLQCGTHSVVACHDKTLIIATFVTSTETQIRELSLDTNRVQQQYVLRERMPPCRAFAVDENFFYTLAYWLNTDSVGVIKIRRKNIKFQHFTHFKHFKHIQNIHDICLTTNFLCVFVGEDNQNFVFLCNKTTLDVQRKIKIPYNMGSLACFVVDEDEKYAYVCNRYVAARITKIDLIQQTSSVRSTNSYFGVGSMCLHRDQLLVLSFYNDKVGVFDTTSTNNNQMELISEIEISNPRSLCCDIHGRVHVVTGSGLLTTLQ